VIILLIVGYALTAIYGFHVGFKDIWLGSYGRDGGLFLLACAGGVFCAALGPIFALGGLIIKLGKILERKDRLVKLGDAIARKK
jgi:hypothetical protein